MLWRGKRKLARKGFYETTKYQTHFIWSCVYRILRTFLVDTGVLSLWAHRKKTFTLPIVNVCGQWVVFIKHLIASKIFLLFPSLLQKSEKIHDG